MAIVGLCLGWWRDHRQLKQVIHDLRNSHQGWDTNQVLGPPDTHSSGDIPTAWASRTPDGQDEWLLLEYDQAVRPSAVLVHETYNPGAVSKVSVFKATGEEVIAWQGVDPTPRTSPRGVSTIPISVQFRTRRVKIYVNSMAVPGWNEIDAVGLRYGAGQTIWAGRAFSSSSFGRNNELPWGAGVGGLTFVP